MTWKRVMDAYELLDSAAASGQEVAAAFRGNGVEEVTVTTIQGPKGSTDFIRAVIRGSNGKSNGGNAPTLGIIGRLGGIGARPERIGFVSDGDGALTAVAAGLKLGVMQRKGDVLPGDVIIATHICPNAPTRPHDPVPFMDSPVEVAQMNQNEVEEAMDAILSVDTTKGNRVINHRGFAISPTVKEGYILRISEDLLDIMQTVTGRLPVVFPLTTQDITPYGNGIYHLNSILQPCVATTAPVVGVAITAAVPVPGCATGASHLIDVEAATRFCIEVGKAFGTGKCAFYDQEEFERLRQLYGPLNQLQTQGKV